MRCLHMPYLPADIRPKMPGLIKGSRAGHTGFIPSGHPLGLLCIFKGKAGGASDGGQTSKLTSNPAGARRKEKSTVA